MKVQIVSCTLLLAVFALTAPAWAAKVEICHIPPGNPSNLNTITISEHALQAHLAHGDFLGNCSAASCPCMRIPQFNIVLANANFCLAAGEVVVASIDPFTETSTPAFAFANSSDAPDPHCGYQDVNTQTSSSLPVTLEQAALCFDAVHDAIDSRGVSCNLN